jgi:hypothetical protein
VAESCEHGNKHSCSLKGGEFFDCESMKRDSAPWNCLVGFQNLTEGPCKTMRRVCTLRGHTDL